MLKMEDGFGVGMSVSGKKGEYIFLGLDLSRQDLRQAEVIKYGE